MGGKIKNLLELFCFNKRALLFGLVLILILVFAPLSAARAQEGGILDIISKAIVNSVALVLNPLIGIISGLLQVLATFLAGLLQGSITYFMSMPVTPGSTGVPEFVEDGWKFSKDLVNIFFLLILAFIGLSTILRLQNYQMQKTLPLLIGVALLVNFSGVLVGFVVDMANIATKFFLSQSTGDTWKGLADNNPFKDTLFTGFDQAAATLALNIVRAIYYVVLVIIYFILITLFQVRTLVLWTLVILSPIVFAAYILPNTRKWWNEWWQNLIQWSMIGIHISFFLFLASKVIGRSFPGGNDPAAQFWAGVMAPFTAILLLYLGVTIAMREAPQNAKGVIDFAKGQAATMGKMVQFAGKKSWAFARDRVSESPKARKTLERAEQISMLPTPAWGEKANWKNPWKWIQRGTATVVGRAARLPGIAARQLGTEADRRDFEEEKAAAMKRDYVGNNSALKSTIGGAGKAGIIAAMIAKKQMADALDKDKVGEGNTIPISELKEAYLKANVMEEKDTIEGIERALVKDIDDNKDGIGKEFIALKSQFILDKDKARDTSGHVINDGLTQKEHDKGIDSFTKKIIEGSETADEIKTLQKGWYDKDETMKAVHLFWGGKQVSQAAAVFSRDFMNQLEATKKDIGWYSEPEKRKDSKGNVTFVPRNMAMPRYLASSAAQGLGISPVENAETIPDVNRFTREARENAAELTRQARATISDLEKRMAELSKISPEPSEKEIKQFTAIASGEESIPRKGKSKDVLRKIDGSTIENLKLQQKAEEKIKKAEELIREVRDRGETTSTLEMLLRKDEDNLRIIRGREEQLKEERERIEAELLKKDSKKNK